MDTKKQQFRVKPIAAAVGLAMVVPFMISSAFAVTQGNLPVNGVVATGAASITTTGVADGNFSQTGAATVTVTANTVIDWNATNTNTNATLNPDATGSFGGFNVGPHATLTMNGAGDNVLNVDTTGNPSELYGTINGTAKVFVANANGIVVGNGATISLPVIGLLGSDTTNFDASGNLPVSFSGTKGTVNVNSGADMTGTRTLIVAGSGTVNVTASNPNLLAPATIIGGVSGILDATNYVFTPEYSDPANGSSVTLSSAPTTVNLAIGSATSPIQQGNVGTVYANGDINNSGDIAVSGLYFTGTLSNSGILQTSSIEGSFGTNSSGIFNNSTLAAPMGNIANSGTITNGSSFGNEGFNVDIAGSFVNTGTISVGGTNPDWDNYLNVTAGSINNSGTINLVSTNGGGSSLVMNATSGSLTMGGTLNAAALYYANFAASAVAGNSVNVNTTISATNATWGDSVYLSGFNVNVNAPVTAGVATNNGYIHAVVGGAPGAQMGVLSIASVGTLNAVGTTHGSSWVEVRADSAPYNVNLAGSVSGNTVHFHGANNVQGAGLITADDLMIAAKGSVNNPNGGGNASNGWLTNSLNVTPYSNGTAGTANVTLSAEGSAIQLFNVAVNGNATYNTGGTSTFTTAGFSNVFTGIPGFYGPAANAGSHLVVQASGNMTLLPGYSGTNISNAYSFSFPGLIVADAGGSLTAATSIDNGMYQNAPAGYGIFLQGSSINLSSPIYTNGNSWVNFSTTPSGVVPPIYGVQQITGTASGVNSYVKTSTVPGTNQSFTGYSMHIRKYTQFTAG